MKDVILQLEQKEAISRESVGLLTIKDLQIKWTCQRVKNLVIYKWNILNSGDIIEKSKIKIIK
jgi:hypothetical protein